MDSDSDQEFKVGDTVMVSWIFVPDGKVTTMTAEYVGTVSITVSGKVQKFMVLKDESAGVDVNFIVGLAPVDAPETLPSITAETFTVCFFPGTLIATPSGERKVEELTSGDPVLTADSGAIPAVWLGHNLARAVPVKWIGRQTVSTLFGPAERLMPVRFAAGSLGGGGATSYAP